MRKYEFTGETKLQFGITLRRIRAAITISFPTGFQIKAGEPGGWIEKESNLEHDGNAWVSGDAMVYGNARVSGNAWVSGDAMVYGNARVSGNAWVSGNAMVYGDARVSGNAWVSGNAMVCGDARVSGNARVSGDARVSGNAWVSKQDHLLQIGAIGSRDDFTTFFRTKTGDIKVVCGCFYGTVSEFIAKVEMTHGDSKHGRVYRLAAELAIAQIDLSPVNENN